MMTPTEEKTKAAVFCQKPSSSICSFPCILWLIVWCFVFKILLISGFWFDLIVHCYEIRKYFWKSNYLLQKMYICLNCQHPHYSSITNIALCQFVFSLTIKTFSFSVYFKRQMSISNFLDHFKCSSNSKIYRRFHSKMQFVVFRCSFNGIQKVTRNN